ncbi:response regulator [Bradyrhizobium sp. WD16]|uniref:response regulator n=1 Tax=Bradyrhizobium sp. WD16 TaxID=1521768 RepID=UPI0020A4118B|nr:response regulator [Bradyrhizobium sp. WD16]UTD25563.1 two-component system response regulator [Bradyrhizobium sp. WD16]
MPDPNADFDIVLIEDNATDAELFIRVLKKRGLADRLIWLKDGREALDFFFRQGAYAGRDATSRPTVIFLDMRLPKVDGLDVLRTIKTEERLKSVPVVVLTSSTVNGDKEEAYKLGANSYVNKPVDFESFASVIEVVARYWLEVNSPPAKPR